MEDDFTLDLIADGKVIVELKVVKELAPIHQAQLMTYMKLTDCKVGLLINFNVVHLIDGLGGSRSLGNQAPPYLLN